ncbi:C-terminal binding protein [Labrys miyagiensis]|nr:C-terminal binding protein [Labrys miyagiensis]
MPAHDRLVVVTDYTFPSLHHEQAAAGAARFATHQCSDAQAVTAAVKGADVALVQFAPMTRAALEGLAPGARVIRYGVGYDNIDVKAAGELGIEVAYVPDYCTDEVADHTATALLASLRKLAALDASVRAGQWAAVAVCKPMRPFRDSMVGFLGLGRIGRAVMERLRPFGFSFLVFDPALSEAQVEALGASKAATTDDLFAAADALALHAPSTPATRGIVNRATLARMKPNAMIVNTARGDLIDAAALAEALANNRIAGAALDVFDSEPLPSDHVLRGAPNLQLTPHAAWYSDASIDRLQALAADEVRRALAGEPMRSPVPTPK